MGVFDRISSRRNKGSISSDTGPAASSRPTPAAKPTKESVPDDSHIANRASRMRAESQRAAYTPVARIANAQAFVTADSGYNAGASNYVQSVMKKKQMMDANKAEAKQQAAKSQAIAKDQMQAAQTRPKGEWPSLPTYVDIPGRDLKNPSYHAMLSHLGVTRGLMLLIDREFNTFLDSEKVSRNKVEKRHLDSAATKTCELINDFLSEKWEIFASIVFVWDASIDEVAFRFTYPASKDQRFAWNEQVKGPYWDKTDWDEWNAGKKRLGLT